MFLNEKNKYFLVLILLFNEKQRLRFLNCAGSYKKMGVVRRRLSFLNVSASSK